MKKFTITEKDVEAIDQATAVLRDVLRGGPGTAESDRETMEALAGLLSIFPKPVSEGAA